jgi:4-hydroxybenzoate polyprenyltransferase
VIQMGKGDLLIEYSVLSFFATLFVYNLQRVFYSHQEDSSLLSVRRKWIFKNQFSIKLLCLLGAAGVAVTFFFNNYRILIYLTPLLVLSIAYFLPIIKLRQNIIFKLLTLAFVWTTVTAVIPAILNHVTLFSSITVLHFFSRFIFMIAICIPFDIRDLKIDQAENIHTLPQKIGETKTRWVAMVCMLLYCVIIFVDFILRMYPHKISLALLIASIINALLISLSNSKRGEYFYVVLIDGTMILQGVALIVAQYL